MYIISKMQQKNHIFYKKINVYVCVSIPVGSRRFCRTFAYRFNIVKMKPPWLKPLYYLKTTRQASTGKEGRKDGWMEGNVLFNDALSTFYLRLYGVVHMVKDHSDRTQGIFLHASSHRQDSTYHGLCYTSCRALARKRNSSISPPWGFDPKTHGTISACRFNIGKIESPWLNPD